MSRTVMLMFTDVPAALEADYHRWYNEVHLPEVLALPGVLGARRFRLAGGEGCRFLALYDLANPEVVNSAAYVNWRANSASTQQWSERFSTFQRLIYEQIYPAA